MHVFFIWLSEKTIAIEGFIIFYIYRASYFKVSSKLLASSIKLKLNPKIEFYHHASRFPNSKVCATAIIAKETPTSTKKKPTL